MSEHGGGGGRERRLSPRFNVSLECGVRLPEEERSSALLFPGTILSGRTRDLSESGLGLILPSIYVGYDCIVDRGRTLVVSLALPSGVVEVRAAPVHYIRHDKGGDEVSYHLGLHIVGMSDETRAHYLDFLGTLSAG